MHGIEHLYIRHLVRNAAHGAENRAHGLSEVLPPVRRQQNQPTVLRPFQFGVLVIRPHCRFQRVDSRVARHEDRFRLFVLPQQILSRLLCRRKMVLRNHADRLPVKFLRKRRIQLIGAQPRLHVSHRNLHIKAGQRGGEGRRRVAMHQHKVGFRLGQHVFQLLHHAGGDVKKRLSVLHDRQIVIRRDVKRAEHLIEHLSVLSGHAAERPDVFSRPQLLNQRTHFNGLRPRAEDQHDRFHSLYTPSSGQMFRVSKMILPFNFSMFCRISSCPTRMTTISTASRNASKSCIWLGTMSRFTYGS